MYMYERMYIHTYVCMYVCTHVLPSHFNVSTTTKPPSLQCNFRSRKQVKISGSHVRTVQGMLQCCHIVLC